MVAAGQARLVTGEWLSKHHTVIDVGIHRVVGPGGAASIVGDVNHEEAREIVAALTPVPRGVGPMTIAMLLSNTMGCFRAMVGAGG